MSKQSDVVIATSIPPSLVRYDSGLDVSNQYQNQCVASWLDVGFKVVSVNSPREVPELARRYPHVSFIPVNRDAKRFSGRRNPLIGALLAVLAGQPNRRVGIMNSDILLAEGDSWAEAVRQANPNAVLIGQRIDVGSLSDPAWKIYPYGFDYFFFDKRLIEGIADADWPFAIGLPWWDYWLPIALAKRTAKIEVLRGLKAIHLEHNNVWEPELWFYMAIHFIEYAVQYLGHAHGMHVSKVGVIVDYCRQLAATSAYPWTFFKRKLLRARTRRQQLNQSIRNGWNEEFYLLANPDAAGLVRAGKLSSGLQHFDQAGRMENRSYKIEVPKEWREDEFLHCNIDVNAAVKSGKFDSGFDYYIRVGSKEIASSRRDTS